MKLHKRGFRRRKPGVSVVTVTNRPGYFDQIVRNYRRQRFWPKQLVIVLNKNSMNLAYYRHRVRMFPNIHVYKVPQHYSLGRCLNYGTFRTKYRFIAKFDDDDYYSPFYLREQVRAMRRTGAGIVGKRAHLKYFEGKHLLVVVMPQSRNRYVRNVAGGSIMFRRRVFRKVRFARITHGEDTNFLRKSRKLGVRIFATSPYNFVGVRRKNKQTHTWKESDENVMRGSEFVAHTDDYRQFAIRPL